MSLCSRGCLRHLSEDELIGWAASIHSLAQRADCVHVLMNNCYGDYGVRNARQLAELLARQM